jgi:hypothetical protein
MSSGDSSETRQWSPDPSILEQVALMLQVGEISFLLTSLILLSPHRLYETQPVQTINKHFMLSIMTLQIQLLSFISLRYLLMVIHTKVCLLI